MKLTSAITNSLLSILNTSDTIVGSINRAANIVDDGLVITHISVKIAKEAQARQAINEQRTMEKDENITTKDVDKYLSQYTLTKV